MSVNAGGSTGGPTEDDVKILIGILAYVEGALSADSSVEMMPKLLARLQRDLRSFGIVTSDDRDETIEALASMNRRLRHAIGETPDA